MALGAIFSLFMTVTEHSCVFEGPASITVDAKGRIAIPTRYRDGLMQAAQGRLHITRHFKEDCLLVFPDNEWERFRDMVAAWPQSAAWQKRMVLNNATGYVLDDTYRLVLTAELREAARIDRGGEAHLVGNGTHLELWDKALYMTKIEQEREKPLPEFLENVSF